jgi:hypothetical protein
MLARETSAPRFAEARDLARGWLAKVAYNAGEHRLNRGYFRQLDKAVATDVHAWGISALGVEGLDKIEPGLAEKMASFVEEHCRANVDFVRADKKTVQVTGFDFVDASTAKALKRRPVISPEWTFQMANAYRRMANDFQAAGQAQKSALFEKKREALIASMIAMALPKDGTLALPYASMPDAPIGHEYNTPVAGTVSAIGVSYGILAIKGYDPLVMPKAAAQ